MELEAAKNAANEILASITDGFYALNQDWRFVYFNAKAEAMLGKASQEVVGRRLFEALPKVEGSEVHAKFRRVMSERRPLDFETIGPTLSHWISFSVNPTRDGGLSVFFRDISVQKQAENEIVMAKAEAERANRAKSKFLAAASHDLRQPVQSLVLLLAVVERQIAANPAAVETVGKIKKALGGLTRLLTSILDISSLDAGVVEAASEAIDLEALLTRLATEYAPKAASAGLLAARRQAKATCPRRRGAARTRASQSDRERLALYPDGENLDRGETTRAPRPN